MTISPAPIKSVLVTGGGAIGQLVSVVARSVGARSITVSEGLPLRRQAALEHGADRALDPSEAAEAVDDGERFDLVFDASGHPEAVDLALRAADPARGRVVLVGNLPAGHGISAGALSAAEPWVTATFRFPGGLGPALGLVVEKGLELDWLVERTFSLEHVHDAFALAMGHQAPLKVQVNPAAGSTHTDQAS